MLQPFVPRLGGKSKIARKLVKRFPPHETYIEPFVGGGSVFLAKPPVKKEVLNDIDKDIYQLWKGMQTSATRLSTLDFTPTRETFDKLKASKPRGKVQRMFRTLYVYRNSFGGMGQNFANKGARKPASNLKRNLQRYKERLKGVHITNQDWKAVLKKHDSESSFSFLDPPYQTETSKWIYKPFAATDLVPTLKKMKCKFLMTFASSPQIRKLFKEAGFKVGSMKTAYIVAPGQRKDMKKQNTLIVQNF